MPARLVRCVKHVMAQGKPESSAWPICISSTGLKPEKKKKMLSPKDSKAVLNRARKS